MGRRPKEKKLPVIWVQIDNEIDLFLRRECARLGKRLGKRLTRPDIVRALITSYYEKRAIGLLVDPDD